MKSDEPKKDKAIGIRLPLETFKKLKACADAERRSVSNYLLLLIERDLEARTTGSYDTINPLQSMPRAAEEGKEYLPGASDAPPGTGSRSANG
jgi:hypothetical protein